MLRNPWLELIKKCLSFILSFHWHTSSGSKIRYFLLCTLKNLKILTKYGLLINRKVLPFLVLHLFLRIRNENSHLYQLFLRKNLSSYSCSILNALEKWTHMIGKIVIFQIMFCTMKNGIDTSPLFPPTISIFNPIGA